MTGWLELLWDGKRERRFTKESVDENYIWRQEGKEFLLCHLHITHVLEM